MLSAALLSALLAATPAKPKLVVLDLTPSGGVEAETAGALTEAVVAEVASRGYFSVVSSKALQTLLGLEKQRQVLGCADQSSCLTELAGALGAAFVARGTLAKLGDMYQLTLETLDPAKAQPVGRSIRIAPDLASLRGQLQYLVAEATGTPLPPPPSRLLPYSLMGAGALAVIGGGFIGLDALSRERAVGRELDNGVAGALGTRASYREEAGAVSAERTVSLVTLAAGAALIGAGLYLNPSDSGSASVALLPAGTGFALVGTFR